MKIVVIDGQGGGIGATIIKVVRGEIRNEQEIWALGTNSIATSRMMKAGANKGASGENAITHLCPKAEVIIGPIGIVIPNAMMGELTPKMATAVSSSLVKKILIPLTQENIDIVGFKGEPLPHLVAKAVMILKEMGKHV